MKRSALVALVSIGIAGSTIGQPDGPDQPHDALGERVRRASPNACIVRDLTAGRIVPSPFSLTSPLTLMAGIRATTTRRTTAYRHPDDQAHASRISTGNPAHYTIVFSGLVQRQYAPAKLVASFRTPTETFASARFGFKAPLLREPYGTIIRQAELSIADGDKLYQSNNVAVAMTHWLNFGDPKPNFCARFNTTRS